MPRKDKLDSSSITLGTFSVMAMTIVAEIFGNMWRGRYGPAEPQYLEPQRHSL